MSELDNDEAFVARCEFVNARTREYATEIAAAADGLRQHGLMPYPVKVKKPVPNEMGEYLTVEDQEQALLNIVTAVVNTFLLQGRGSGPTAPMRMTNLRRDPTTGETVVEPLATEKAEEWRDFFNNENDVNTSFTLFNHIMNTINVDRALRGLEPLPWQDLHKLKDEENS